MNKVRWSLAGAMLLLGAAWWWWIAHGWWGPTVEEQIAGIRAAGTMLSIEERCAGHVRSERDLTVWFARLAEAMGTSPRAVPAGLDEGLELLEQSPLDAWRAKGWALDEASWVRESAHLARQATELSGLSAVFRAVGEYERLDPCSLIEGLEPPLFHPQVDRVLPFPGIRAAEFSLLQGARSADLEVVERDLEALLLLSERLHEPASLVYFDAWALCLDKALLALEGSLTVLAGRIDLARLARRLDAFAPERLLLESMAWEQAYGLRVFEWLAAGREPTSVLPIPVGWDAGRDFAAWRESCALGQRYLEGAGVSLEDVQRFRGSLDKRTMITAMLMPFVGDQERVVRRAETRLALARTALRLLQHGQAGWEAVPREPDPWSNEPLAAEVIDDESVLLRSAGRESEAEERKELEWTVLWP